jgi:copper transport protein
LSGEAPTPYAPPSYLEQIVLDVDRSRPPQATTRRPRTGLPGPGRGRARQLLAVAALVVAVLAGAALAIRFVSTAPDAGGQAGARTAGPGPATAGAPVGALVRATRGDGTLTASLKVDRLTVELLVLPAKVGANQVHVTVYAPEGTAQVDDFRVAFEPPPGAGPAGNLAPDRVAVNHFLVPAAMLPAPGDWRLRLTMRVTGTGDDGTTLVPAQAVEADVVLPVS